MPRIDETETIKLRAPWPFRYGLLGLGLIALVVDLALRTGGSADLYAGYLVGLGVVGGVMNSWFGVNLTPAAAVVNSLRRRRIPWASIQAITQEAFMGGRRIVLWTDRGQAIPLRAPILDFTRLGNRGFQNGYHAIGQYWLAHRGPFWHPM